MERGAVSARGQIKFHVVITIGLSIVERILCKYSVQLFCVIISVSIL